MAARRRTWLQRLHLAASEPVYQLRLSLVILVLIALVGTVGYVLIEGMRWDDALYMTVITITTVGFREVGELSQAGKWFTIVLILGGVGAGAWALTRAFEVALGQSFWITVQRRRMNEQVGNLRNHYIVCGYGRLGGRIVRDLEARGEPFVIVDQDPALEQRLLEERIPYVIGDATRDDVLLAANVGQARGLVSALDSDANNVLTVLTARELSPRVLIVARANSEMSESKLHRAGADRVVTPESIGGHRLAIALLRPGVHDFLSRIFRFGETDDMDVGQVQVPTGSPFAGQTIAGCDLRRIRNISILAIQKPDGEFVLNPGAERVIGAGETLIVIGPAEAVYDLEALYAAPKG